MQGATYDGVGFEGRICGVSILRAGEVSADTCAFGIYFILCAGYGGRSTRSLQKRPDWEDTDSKGKIVHAFINNGIHSFTLLLCISG